MNTVVFKIEGMRCDGCAAKVQTRLGATAGVREACAIYEAGEARVRYDLALTSEDARAAAIGQLGYRVTGRVPACGSP